MEILAGTLTGPVIIKLNGLSFEVDILGGHKTGLYLDQQVNYERVAAMAKGAQVLDCFSFLLAGLASMQLDPVPRMFTCWIKARMQWRLRRELRQQTNFRKNVPLRR